MDTSTRHQFAGIILQLVMYNFGQIWQNGFIHLEGNDEEENIAMLHVLSTAKTKATRIQNYVEHTVSNYSEQEFQSHFRLRYAAFEAVENKLGPELSSPGQPQYIPPRKQLLTVLWLLATPDSFRSVGERFNLSKGGVYRCFVRVIKLLNNIAGNIIKWPSATSKPHIKQSFNHFGGLQNVIGAIDGTFIEIKAPKEHAFVYTCRKCFYAMQLQAIAIPNLKFVDIFTGYPGSVGDRRVFQNSNIFKNIVANKNYYFEHDEYILGDKAYPVLTWCVPPFINRGTLTQRQVLFNGQHAKTRQVVERAFALLFGRYRRLKYLDMNKFELMPATILAVCVLHNICLDHADLDFNQQAIAEGEAFMESQVQRLLASTSDEANEPLVDALNSNEGILFRNNLAETLVA